MRGRGFLFCVLFGIVSVVIADDWIEDAYREAGQLETQGMYDKASAALQPVLQKYPHGYTVNLRLGWLAYISANYTQSEQYYRQACKVLPDSFEPRIALLLPLLASKQWQPAEQTAYQILKDDPYNYYTNIRLLKALQAQKKYELAQRQTEKLLTRYPVNVPLLESFAMTLLAKGDASRGQAIRKDIEILRAGYSN